MMSKAQIAVLTMAQQIGNAIDESKLHKNGAHLRMITRMTKAGLLDPRSYDITEKGRQALRDAGLLKDQQKFRIRSQGETWTLIAPASVGGQPVTRAMAEKLLGQLAARVFDFA